MTRTEQKETNVAFLRSLTSHGPALNELAQPIQSQTVELIQSGWKGIGYLMVAPVLYDDGTLYGCKRVAHDVSSARELDQWFRERVAQGYTPLFRYYLHHSRKQARIHADDMKGVIVHEERSCEYSVLVEWGLLPFHGVSAEDMAEVIKYAVKALDARSVASEFALEVSMSSKGMKIEHSNSMPTLPVLREAADKIKPDATPPSPGLGRTLTVIGAYWNSNITEGPDRGFCLIFRDNLIELAEETSKSVKRFEREPLSEREEFLAGDIYLQLREAARILWSTSVNGVFRPESLSDRDHRKMLVYGLLNVAILESQGRLVADEYNGMQYIYEGGSSIVLRAGTGKTSMPIA